VGPSADLLFYGLAIQEYDLMKHVRLPSLAAVAAPVLSAGVLVGAVAAKPQQVTSAVGGGARNVSASASASPARGTQARQATPYAKAMNEAAKVTDPERKIEAFRKVIAEFPKTPAVDLAEQQILATLIGMGSAATSRIAEQARRVVDGAPAASQPATLRSVSASLLAGDLLLELAEHFARRAVDLLDQASFVDARRNETSERAAQAAEQATAGESTVLTPPPFNEQAAIARFKTERQAALVTYARALDKRFKTAEAAQVFKDAYDLAPKTASAATAAVRLAEYAKRDGRDREQFHFLSALALAGRLTATERANLEAVYRKLHGGSLTGLDQLLDARYAAENPNPIEVKPYAPTPERTDRLVLAEVFTGSGCPPCVGADLAFEAAMQRYSRQDLAVLMYHLHVPRPDPMTNPWSVTREKFYQVRGVPAYYIDGEADGAGGGGADAAPRIFSDRLVPTVEKHLTKKAETMLTVQASMSNGVVSVQARVGRPIVQARRLRLHLALAEELIRYSGENGVRFHPMVVRSLASQSVPHPTSGSTRPTASGPDAEAGKVESDSRAKSGEEDLLGFAIDPAVPMKIDYHFNVEKIVAEAKSHLDDYEVTSDRFGKFEFMDTKHVVDAGNLVVVAFVQDEESRKILQAAFVDLHPQSPGSGRK
jgi:hypothetical protein